MLYFQDIQVGYVVTTTPGGGQQQTAYVYATPGASYPVVQTAHPPAQAAYPAAQAAFPPTQDYKPTEGGQPAMYPNLGPTAPPDAPPEYTEKGQAYWLCGRLSRQFTVNCGLFYHV